MRPWKENLKALGGGLALLLAFTLPWAAYTAACLHTGSSVAAGGTAELTQGEDEAPLIALTFDDGPSSATTPALLDGLARRGVHATFFLVGSMAADNHDLVRRMSDEGHQIGVHTYDHSLSKGLTGLSEAQFRAQVDTTRDLLTALTGQTQYALRPPYGFVDDSVRRWAEGPIILWSVDPEDWKDHDVERIVASVVERVEDGDVILMHDIYQASVEAAVRIVDALEEKGFCFVTVEQLMARQGIAPEAGVLFPQRP